MEIRFFAGIGSRQTPPDILRLMSTISLNLVDTFWLRSGGAIGADTAFYTGRQGKNSEIFRANDATPEAIEIAKKYHPAWNRCSPIAQKLHGRNAMILLGKDLNSYVEFVVCWTPGGAPVGGTAMGIKIAEAYSIPVYNLYNLDSIPKWLI